MKSKLALIYVSIFILICHITSCKNYLLIELEKLDTLTTNTRSTNETGTHYYWYNGKQIKLNIKDGNKYILFTSTDTSKIKANLISPIIGKEFVISSGILRVDPKIQEAKYRWDIVSTSTRALNTNVNIIYEGPCFESETGHLITLTHLFYVKLRDPSDLSKLQEIAAANKVTILGSNEFMPLWYTLGCSSMSEGNTLDMANLFHQTNLFEACEPDFINSGGLCCVNDTYFSSQWNLKNTGQKTNNNPMCDIVYCNTRAVTAGNNSIIVAIIDGGIELTHPDINIYRSKSYDTETGTSPSKIYGEHGTKCAGIVSAYANNSMGVAGIAPSCPVMSISANIGKSPNSIQGLANGINFAWINGASVISNSWYVVTPTQLINDAITNALSRGRNNKGCVIVCGSGNEDERGVVYPANLHPDILVVGAMSPCMERKSERSCDGQSLWGSNYGPELDIVAPGVFVPTTTLNGGYTLDFYGTSAATPHVAAVAALILSVDPTLTQRKVSDIIESTARKVNQYNYQIDPYRPNGTWNEEVGYGLLNAFSAVAKAQKRDMIYLSQKTINSSQTITAKEIWAEDVTIGIRSKLTLKASTITLGQSFTLEEGSQLELSNN